MLRALHIANFALVAELDIEFGPGLTVITGESGAGKSILLDALALVLGARVRRSQLRPGAQACDVSAEFDVGERPRCRNALAALDLLAPDDERACLVRRWAGEGRSRAFVNGVPTTLSTLRSLTSPLVDIHGQSEHRQLLLRETQRRLLDEFGVSAALLETVADNHRTRARQCERLAQARAAAERGAERRSLLRYQVDELRALGDIVGRAAELAAEHKRLQRAQELLTTAGAAQTELEDALLGQVARLAGRLERADDEPLGAAAELVLSAQTHLEEALGELRNYLASFPEDDNRLAELDGQLTVLHDMARKHGVGMADLERRLTELAAELANSTEQAEQVSALEAAAAAASERFQTSAAALSEERRAAAGPFCAEVNAVLAELGITGAALRVRFAPAESAAGLEQVEFDVQTSPRFPPGPLAAIASGGELARISLAIDVVAAARSKLPCLILDEADVGVGGTGADVLGRMLRRLSANTQVIVVTHAPQIAALGDHHLKVSKTSAHDTAIDVLSGAERAEELARMLGGRTVTDDSRAYARTLLAEAGEAA